MGASGVVRIFSGMPKAGEIRSQFAFQIVFWNNLVIDTDQNEVVKTSRDRIENIN